MARKRKAPETGTVIGRHKSWRGAMISVAVTLLEIEWDTLTRSFAVLWEEVEDDFDEAALTLDERIALFVGGHADQWSRVVDPDRFDNDLNDDVPF